MTHEVQEKDVPVEQMEWTPPLLPQVPPEVQQYSMKGIHIPEPDERVPRRPTFSLFGDKVILAGLLAGIGGALITLALFSLIFLLEMT